MAEVALTPMMEQFYKLKAKHPDAILLFRCGDFYETYQDDAVTAAKVLGITLTHRNNKGKGMDISMAGFPHHALDSYLPKLVRAGFRVAICDQLEDPKLTKKLVKRGITELVTPGIALSDTVLASKENNFLAALNFGRSTIGLSLLDISTGEFSVTEGSVDYIAKLFGDLQPKEILIVRGMKERFVKTFGDRFFTFQLDDWMFNERSAIQRLCKHFKVHNMKGHGVAHLTAALTAAGAILYYLDDTQHTQISHITRIQRMDEDRNVRMDNFTMRNLEVLQSMHEEGTSLLQILDRTSTPMGARMLRRWLCFPLCSVEEIVSRQDGIEYFMKDTDYRNIIEDNLSTVGDMERLISKLAVGRITPREVQQLRHDLDAIVPIKAASEEADLPAISALGAQLNPCDDIRLKIAQVLCPVPPSQTNKGGYIAKGVNEELDELRTLSTDGRNFLLQIQRREIEKTGIPSLKIGFNNVFGYYLEVRNTFKDKVPPEWIRKQTLVNAERYITQELKEYEEKILGAEDKILALEAKIYADLIQSTLNHVASMQQDAKHLAYLDTLLSMAKIATERRYVRPVVDDSTELEIIQGRHPVIETLMPIGDQYVPNDVRLDTERQQIIIITGPNMSGKSALLRQTALIVLMAQAGSFVPADSAHVGIVDKIFTRVGASDNISNGESTFMVEMSEAANIMNNFSNRSSVLFDELGRGTSTYDGISIAWAIVEYLHENSKGHPRTLFATHYHELNEMEKSLQRVHNFNVSIKEVGNQVVFLRKLEPGGSAHSFGIHVARMAGMPASIVKRAEVVLSELERENGNNQVSKPIEEIGKSRESIQLSLFQLDDPVLRQVRDRILNIDINKLTPLEALNVLNEIKEVVK